MTVVKQRPKATTASEPVPATGIPKARTGIRGLDEITGGGLPASRPTLITGPAGSGKTLLAVEFLVHGALEFGEPGVLLSFEETAEEIAANVASLGFDLNQMAADGLLIVDSFHLDPALVIETGEYDLEGLFIRLALAVESVGAKRVVLDTIEVLFGSLSNESIVRAELSRLFTWLKKRGLTAVVTGEPGANTLTRHGIEEYVSDCVIALDHRVQDEISTRRLRVVKYRGSIHGTNEYPFLITDRGVAVLPLSSLGLNYGASDERVSSGIPRLDHMLGGGYFKGSSVLITGGAGTGKTTLVGKALEAACARGERALLVSFEESAPQLVRDLASVGIRLQPWLASGLLRVWSGRPSAYGLESHLETLSRHIKEFAPNVVALDAMTALQRSGAAGQVTSAMVREIDLLKSAGITTLATSLTHTGEDIETSAVQVTSIMDTWLLLRNIETNGERNRLLFIRKSRGSAHSNQVREFVLTDAGPDLLDVYVGGGQVLTGSARIAQEAEVRRADSDRRFEIERRHIAYAQHAAATEAQIAALRAGLEAEEAELARLAEMEETDASERRSGVAALAQHRWADPEQASVPSESGEVS